MSFIDSHLGQNRPASVRGIELPRRERYHPSPADWRDETLYFLLPDRFSDGQEESRLLFSGGGAHQIGETLPVRRTAGGTAYVEIHRIPASEALVLMNHP
jgi:hypothetical protein